ncbi:restriction endonuclease [Pseudomonas protegens]|uniref:restriction endonuclease n=1 Tax=Pseudomonas protegens TaxID=380021 RepID=UPI000363392C|nr:restriction endonuclease [Pseudomonas protegens]ROM29184.1 restriction endonuclease [Pseudomonas protegens]ROM36817.1 restriction endonuclease [Pseudomonas protegens]
MQTRVGSLQEKISARGNYSYSLELWHGGLNKHRIIRGESVAIVKMKASLQVNEWDERWALLELRDLQRAEKTATKLQLAENKALAAERTQDAQLELDQLAGLLKATLDVDDTLNWDDLKDRSPFPEHKPLKPQPPAMPKMGVVAPEPTPQDQKYLPKLGILEWLVPSRKARVKAAYQHAFEVDHANWLEQQACAQQSYADAQQAHAKAVEQANETYRQQTTEWEARRNQYNLTKAEEHAQVDAKRAAYEALDPDAIVEYCDLVLSASDYPAYFPQEFDLDYDATAKILVVDYKLPAPDDLPRLKAVKFVPTREEFEEQNISDAQAMKLYDDVLYQITLRTIHELFEANKVEALTAVVVNGIVTALDRTTGKDITACVLSLHAKRDEFTAINLEHVDPKACFKSLKGVGSSKLHGLAAVAPIIQLNRNDKRFVASYEVANTLDEGVNLAAIGWEDFEHLIREMFEKEFSTQGGEVKVTQASRDGGVDAIAFDPDPIRGGKIVIQAKRYTNPVGVSAVRDLYGTVMNEGANKGILVTTSSFGPDSYAFANGKPLVLLSGANLLHMLEKHGHRARIDLQEAKRLAAEP